MIGELTTKHGVEIIALQADHQEPIEAGNCIVKSAKANFTTSDSQLLINILINNAGISGYYKLGDVPITEFHRIYAINVLAPIIITQSILPFLPRDRSGRIINISSIASTMGFETHTLYGGTKAALDAMTRTWARELAERATVNAVNPSPKQLEPFQLATPLSAVRDGFDRPDLVKLANTKMAGRRPAYWSEVAGIVGMLCGEDSAWCTGSVIYADGGLRFST
ncbi:putative short chain dehydrogenase/ reductase [Dactylonectria estremocensis]|uniref:Short chain dehydrogenase/ reductase n=1 Tax=Dactylonectria estremocensis TaxID=1079267 RepID=A0A9P9IEA6_9HYPO|nr:putative short chain dehydrogenase/ reductase [Dactylonectria estremocensis]